MFVSTCLCPPIFKFLAHLYKCTGRAVALPPVSVLVLEAVLSEGVWGVGGGGGGGAVSKCLKMFKF